MKNTLLHRALSVLLLLVILMPMQTFAQPPTAAADGMVTFDFRDVELTDLVQTISELTGRNFLYDDTVRGKVTIVSPDSMTLNEAYQLFLSVLNVRGYTVVPSGKVNKIVMVKLAKESNLPTVSDDRKMSSDQYITRLIRLQHLDAAVFATTVLAPLLPATGNITTYPPTNTIIITESAANIDRLMRIIQELDQPGAASILEVLPLLNADADEVAKICNDILAQPNATPVRRSRRGDTTISSQGAPSKIIAYKRTNSLIVMADAEELVVIKELIARIDQVSEGKRSNINLYYLENADAGTLATTLNEILTGIKAQTRQVAGESKSPLSSGPVTITADKPTNALIINASPDDYETIAGIIKQLDIKRKQVYVEALILELSMDATQKLGASLQGAVSIGSNSMAFGTSNLNTTQGKLSDLTPVGGVPSLLSKTINGLLLGGMFSPITVTGLDGNPVTVPALSVLIDLAKTDSDVNILSAPRLLTSDNEEAEIIVGSNVPIITQRLTSSTNPDSQSVAVERKDVALTLRFTPQVIDGDLVRLNVFQEITDLASTNVGNVDNVGPTLTKRLVRNTVLAQNGKTIVLGGLIGTNVQKTISKVPLLGDIPLLGWLFKHQGTIERKTNLLVFINPTIIKSSDDLARVTGRNRQTADGFMTGKVIDALPENFFVDPGSLSVPVAPGQ